MSWPRKKVDHHHLLDGKSVADNALPTLEEIRELVPEKLHHELDRILERFEDELVDCDVHENYEEKE